MSQYRKPILGPTGNPGYPGSKQGLSVSEAQKQTNKQKRCKGYQFNLNVGLNEFNIDLSGTARMLLGLRFGVNVPFGARFSILINNETVIEQASIDLFAMQTIYTYEYFEYLRFLTGTDSIKLTIESSIALDQVPVNFYYF